MPKRRELKVFISYAREDLDSARRLYSDLKAHGLRPWLDKEDLLPGDDWRRAVVAAIQKCDYFLALLSSNSVQKTGFVQRELREALSALDEKPDGTKYIIPARLDDCSPSHVRLTDLNWVDLFPSWEVGLNRVLLALNISAASELGARPKSRAGSRTRLTLDLSSETMNELRQLQELSGSATIRDVMNQALSVLAFVDREASAGHSFFVQREGKNIEIVLPVVQPRRARPSEFAELAVDSRE